MFAYILLLVSSEDNDATYWKVISLVKIVLINVISIYLHSNLDYKLIKKKVVISVYNSK